jgi:hypothetical protein
MRVSKRPDEGEWGGELGADFTSLKSLAILPSDYNAVGSATVACRIGSQGAHAQLLMFFGMILKHSHIAK